MCDLDKPSAPEDALLSELSASSRIRIESHVLENQNPYHPAGTNTGSDTVTGSRSYPDNLSL